MPDNLRAGKLNPRPAVPAPPPGVGPADQTKRGSNMERSTVRQRLGVLAAVLGLAFAGATSATATVASRPGPVPSQLAPIAKQVVPLASIPCNTTFTPSAPHGAPMTQLYHNCANYTKTVCPSLTTSAGTTTWWDQAQTAYPGGVVSWYYSSTVTSGQYTTVYC